MTQTITIIGGLCFVGVVTWTVLLWSNQRFLRVFLGVSAVLHGLLFVIPFAPGHSAPDAATGAPLIPFTIVQGTNEEPAGAVAVEAPAEDTIGLVEEPAADVPDKETVAVETKPREEPAAAVDPGLPEISDMSWYRFEAHPGAASYRKELQRVIQRHFEVPKALDERGYEGRIKVWLSLSRDGRLNYAFIDPRVRSAEPEINALTEENVKRIAKEFPPFPEGVTDYDVTFYIIIDYRNLRNR